jgi:hypothetical protein
MQSGLHQVRPRLPNDVLRTIAELLDDTACITSAPVSSVFLHAALTRRYERIEIQPYERYATLLQHIQCVCLPCLSHMYLMTCFRECPLILARVRNLTLNFESCRIGSMVTANPDALVIVERLKASKKLFAGLTVLEVKWMVLVRRQKRTHRSLEDDLLVYGPIFSELQASNVMVHLRVFRATVHADALPMVSNLLSTLPQGLQELDLCVYENRTLIASEIFETFCQSVRDLSGSIAERHLATLRSLRVAFKPPTPRGPFVLSLATFFEGLVSSYCPFLQDLQVSTHFTCDNGGHLQRFVSQFLHNTSCPLSLSLICECHHEDTSRFIQLLNNISPLSRNVLQLQIQSPTIQYPTASGGTLLSVFPHVSGLLIPTGGMRILDLSGIRGSTDDFYGLLNKIPPTLQQLKLYLDVVKPSMLGCISTYTSVLEDFTLCLDQVLPDGTILDDELRLIEAELVPKVRNTVSNQRYLYSRNLHRQAVLGRQNPGRFVGRAWTVEELARLMVVECMVLNEIQALHLDAKWNLRRLSIRRPEAISTWETGRRPRPRDATMLARAMLTIKPNLVLLEVSPNRMDKEIDDFWF